MASRSGRIAGTPAWLLVLGILGGSAEARAGVSYELVFRSTGTNQVAFASVAEARAASVVSDLILTSTDALFLHSISVGWDDSRGLDLAQAARWPGVILQLRPFIVVHSPLGPDPCPDLNLDPGFPYCSGFNGARSNPQPPPSLPPGTYNIGTIVWDTTAIGPGQSSVFPFVLDGIDVTAVVRPPDGSDILDITGTETLFPSLITVVPEPATAGLLGLGLCGLLLARRRARNSSET